jgi:hypothetical protein
MINTTGKCKLKKARQLFGSAEAQGYHGPADK